MADRVVEQGRQLALQGDPAPVERLAILRVGIRRGSRGPPPAAACTITTTIERAGSEYRSSAAASPARSFAITSPARAFGKTATTCVRSTASTMPSISSGGTS